MPDTQRSDCTAAGMDLSVDFVGRPDLPYLWECRDCGRQRRSFASQEEAERNFYQHPHPASRNEDDPFRAIRPDETCD